MNKQVKKIAENVTLVFNQVENSEKFTFSSSNPRLQAWAETVNNKKVKASAISFVVKAAKEFWFSGAQIQAPAIKDCGRDFVSSLNLLSQKERQPAPVYTDLGANGPDHAPTFWFRVVYKGQMAKACGASKKEARQAAAQKLLGGEATTASAATAPAESNFRQELKIYCDRRQMSVDYTVTPHNGGFMAVCYVDGEDLGVGQGSSKKIAQEVAAQSALGELEYTV